MLLLPDSVASRLLTAGFWLPLVLGAGLPPPHSATIPSRIWQTTPGARYNESFLLGNGRLGAAVAGKVTAETVPVNEDSFWSGPALDRVNPDAHAHLAEMQNLINAGRPGAAATLGSYAYAGTPVSTRHYDAVGDVELVMGHGAGVRGYERWLDLADATAGVAYTVAATNVTYTREYLVSSPADLVAVRLAADAPGAVSFTAHLRRGQGGSLNRWQDYGAKAGPDTVVMGGSSGGGPDAIRFSAGARVVARGGTVRTLGDTVLCDGADEAWLYFTAWTTVRRPDPRAAVLADLAAVGDDEGAVAYYDRLRAAHVADYQRLAGRVTLDLGASSPAQRALNTSDRLAALATRFDPELVALYFHFGRYLLIASSRSGTMAAHLQGIWNDRLDPQWGSKYTININTEMNYWPAFVTNLAELNEPLFDLIARLHASGKATARTMYGARGAVAHHNTDIWGDSAPQDNHVASTYWPSGLAWMVTHLWEHYLYTGDAATLRRHYGALRDAALFYLDFLTEDPATGWLVTNPSSSPENAFYVPGSATGETTALAAGPTMDNSLVRNLLGIVLEAQAVLQLEEDGAEGATEEPRVLSAAQLRATRARLPPLRVNGAGGLMEWLEDYNSTEPGHRHWSHLWGLFPGAEVTAGGDARVFAAARATLAARLGHGGGDTGWSRAWAVALAARLGDAAGAGASVEHLLVNLTYGASLLDSGPPAAFQLDGNYGGTAGLAEMLLQSHEYVADGGVGNRSSSFAAAPHPPPAAFVGHAAPKTPLLRLLPALPRAWAAAGGGGRAAGLVARGGFEVDVAWDAGARLVRATLRSRRGGDVWVTVGPAPPGDAARGGNDTMTPRIRVSGGGGGTGAFVRLRAAPGQEFTVGLA